MRSDWGWSGDGNDINQKNKSTKANEDNHIQFDPHWFTNINTNSSTKVTLSNDSSNIVKHVRPYILFSFKFYFYLNIIS